MIAKKIGTDPKLKSELAELDKQKHASAPFRIQKGVDTNVFHVYSGKMCIASVNGKANALLIAAAPNLLEACRIVLQGLEDYETGNPEWENNLTADIGTLKAVIAKAS